MTGMTPLVSCNWRTTCFELTSLVNPIFSRFSRGTTPQTTGTDGRNLAIMRAALPVDARTTIHFASVLYTVPTAEEARDSITDIGPSLNVVCTYDCHSAKLSTQRSASIQMRLIVFTDSTGKHPAAVSPLSITQSVPSSTAFATSVHSARVGFGFLIMLSSICVAVMTGFPTMFDL
eukprot:scaffold377_cov563-Prasinococcus_capsulatus_cf.AAC.18